MKKNVLFIFVAMLFATCMVVKAQGTKERFQKLLEDGELFKLRSELASKSAGGLSPEMYLYFQASVDNAFNRSEQTMQGIDKLLGEYRPILPDSIVKELLILKSDCYIKQYKYRESIEALDEVLAKYVHLLDSTEKEDVRDSQDLFLPLKDISPQKIHQQHDVTIPCKQNQFNHYMLPVSVADKSEEFIFDTGANISTISQSCAERLGFRIFDNSVNVTTSTNIKVNPKIAVADSLRIGEMLFENVVFLVLPDEHLTFPQIDYTIRGIIGYPVMNQMREIILSKDGFLTVPLNPTKKQNGNLYLNGLTPIVCITVESDTLIMSLDTGAVTSELSKKYFDANRDKVLANGIEQRVQRGGAGGVIEETLCDLTNVQLVVGSKTIILPTLSVLINEYTFSKKLYGNLGQDVLLQSNRFVLNFESMYLELED